MEQPGICHPLTNGVSTHCNAQSNEPTHETTSMNKRPNFLFIMTDQHRADHLGCNGNTIVRTPNLDAIAANGTSFDRFYVANPVCMPNRSSIMTGRLPSLHGVRHNGIPLSMNDTTFVELLRDAGYKTALVGKSHLQNFTGLPAVKRYQPDPNLHTPSERLREAYHDARRGPEYDLEDVNSWATPIMQRWPRPFYGFEHFEIANDHADLAGGDYKLWAREHHHDFDSLVGQENALPDARYNAPQAWRTAVPESLYSTTWIADRANHQLERLAGEQAPFFLKISFPDPHHPFTPPGKYWDMYNPADMQIPASFGKSRLKPVIAMQQAMRDGTDPRDNQSPFAVSEDELRQILALTFGMITMVDDAIGRIMKQLKTLGLDNNTVVVFTADHGDYMGDHGVMLKLLLHMQGLIRVPFIWREPDAVGASRCADLGSAIDIAPTILARAGIQPYNGIQGRNLFDTPAPAGVLVEEDSSRPMTGFDRFQRLRTLVTPDWRMTLRQDEDWSELYNLRDDPHELHNLYDDPAYREQRDTLTEQLVRHIIRHQDVAPLPSMRA